MTMTVTPQGEPACLSAACVDTLKCSSHFSVPSQCPPCKGPTEISRNMLLNMCAHGRHDCGGQGVISVTSNIVPNLMSSLMLRKQPQLDDRQAFSNRAILSVHKS